MTEPADPYKVLQVDPDAKDDVVKAAYRRLARRNHPDLAVGPEAAARMTSINAAWNLVGTPAARAAYDRARSAAANGPADRHASPAAHPGRKQSPATSPAPPASHRPAPAQPPPETVSRDWTSGRSTVGGGFDPSMRTPEGLGAAGPPPGRPSGSVLNFGRYSGWSLGEIARHDLEYIEWLDRAPIGRMYREEVDTILRAGGRRESASTEATEHRGLFRRR